MQHKEILKHTLWTMSLLVALSPTAIIGQQPNATFYRGINLNGPAIVIDGQQWEAGDAENLRFEAMAFDSQHVPLKPATDSSRAKMIRSSRWGRTFSLEFQSVPDGDYQVFAYVWEDNNSEKYSIQLNDKTVVAQYNSGTAGTWKRLGPWKSKIRGGSIKLSSSGGAANFSGIEVWSGNGAVPDPYVTQFASAPTADQLHFFESRIRPLLIDHCYDCHNKDSDELGGNLLLDSRVGIIKGGDNGQVLMPGDPDNSLLMKAVGYKDPELKMPPDEKLADDQIADLAEWIRMRAPDPRTEDTAAVVKAKSEIDWDKARDFWSLRPLSKDQPPAVKNPLWVNNPIDQYIAAKLDAAGLPPAEDASKRTLIRRATFDLIGLPPTPEEIDEFIADDSPDAFAKVVDRLLQSTHYGQRWGRHWLDVVRYADTAGDNSDYPIPQAHLYRNWVIEAFNRDLPYDQFVREQLAGDLLGGDTDADKRSRLIATGYIASSRRFGSRVDDYPWHLTIEDTIDNLGRTFLATSINCARCHDHKFDPVTTEDYYALYGFFHSTRYPWPGIELEKKQRDFASLADPLEIKRIQQEREAVQKELDNAVKKAKKDRDAATDDARKTLDEVVKQAEDAARIHAAQPLPYETFYAVVDAQTIEDVPVQLKGDPAKTGQVVPRRFLKVFHGETLAEDDSTSGRLQLANWIVNRDNPLTARVMVNRIWLNHFGKALVSTPNDFGRHGQVPTHPELLDWLAQHFIDSGWSIKAMHRTIMLSHTYRMSSNRTSRSVELDPSNHLLTTYPSHRLDAEAIRDTLLVLGGNLDATPGGSHPFPPPTEWKFTQHNPFKAEYEMNRRSVYLMTQRIQRHQYLAIFDGADPSASTPMRLISTTPLQALYLLNDKFVHEQAAAIAKRLLAEQANDVLRVDRLWLLMFGRFPDASEANMALEFLTDAGTKLVSEPDKKHSPDLEIWQSLLRSLIRTNEFVYVD
jgi:Protein of unknown function (DUF1553)/Protein of unknown function (DUF1549)/Planctomycete cytochrome C